MAENMQPETFDVKHFKNEFRYGKINLTCINVSLNVNLEEIEAIALSHGEKKVHVIALTDIQLRPAKKNYFNIPGYNAYFNYGSDGSGGVALYVHESVANELVQSNCYFNEINTLTVLLNDGGLNPNITVIYCPPKVFDSNFDDQFIECIRGFLEKGKRIIVGNMNIDILKNDENSRNYREELDQKRYQILNKIDKNFATYTSDPDVTSILSHILSNVKDYSYSVCTVDTWISDDKQLFIGIDGEFDEPSKIFEREATFISNKFKKFRKTLKREINPTERHDIVSISDAFENAKAASGVKLTKSTTHLSLVDPNLIDTIIERNKVFFSMAKDEHDDFKKFTTLKSKAEKMKEKNQINSDKLNKCQKIEKFDEIISNKRKFNGIWAIKTEKGEILHDNYDIAEEFRRYFMKASKTLCGNDNIDVSHIQCASKIMFSFETQTEDKVASEIKLAKIPSNPKDKNNLRLLQENVNLLKKPLKEAINQVFQTGIIPDFLKKVRIVPIYKKGDRALCSNYRPISKSHPFAKLLDSLMGNALNEFLTTNNILDDALFGFRTNSGQQPAVSILVNSIQTHLDKSGDNYASCIFFDFRKAFESISHSILLAKLDAYGIRETALELLKNYFTNRKQFVDIHRAISKEFEINCGISQGSYLFIIFILFFMNDLLKKIFNGKPIIYVDDIAIVYTGIAPNELEAKMQEDVDKLAEWANVNLLELNIGKTACMAFSLNSEPIKLNIFVNNTKIDQVEQMIYLGLHLQSNMKWDNQINSICENIGQLSNVIHRIGKSVKDEKLLDIYNTKINQSFTYLAIVWGSSASTNDIEKLQTIQDLIIEKLFNCVNINADQTRKKHRILNIKQMIRFEKCKFYFKVDKEIFIQFKSIKNCIIDGINGNDCAYNGDIGKNSVFHSAMTAYNKLDENMKILRNPQKFHKILKKTILDDENNNN